MTNEETTGGSAEAEHQQDDSTRGRVCVGIAIGALVFVLILVASMIWYMEKKRCNPKDCEKCSDAEESWDRCTKDDIADTASTVSSQR